MVLVGGVHGDEPAGCEAIERVFGELDPELLSGTVVGLRGNLRAASAGVRFLERDLNRGWTAERLTQLVASAPATLCGEDLEQLDLFRTFRTLASDSTGTLTVLDLHTHADPGPPFVSMSDVLRNRRIAFSLPLPVVLGLEEVNEGSMLGYLCDAGHVGVSVQGGLHREPSTVARLEAAAWLALVATGSLAPEDVPGGYAQRRALLEDASEGLPTVIEVRHRHARREGDQLELVPGVRSFQPVKKRQVVARDVRGDLRAPQAGFLLLPRDRSQHGYFIARPVAKLWLGLSAGLRRVRADRVLARLPGVERHPVRGETYLVDPRVA
ncbi:MAG: succinylglutamate desuccinylase/aspartoacylase family protein, partial [Myxococcota bacterium]